MSMGTRITFTSRSEYEEEITDVTVEISGGKTDFLYNLNNAYLDFLKRLRFDWVVAIQTLADNGEIIGSTDPEDLFNIA